MKKNKKKILCSVYSALFIGICLVPAVTMPLTGKGGTAENRKLAEMPKVKTEDGSINTEYFSEFETYFSEHFGLRSQLVTLDGQLRSQLLGTSSNDDVVVGSDGWLFYGETLNDYMNINTLSDRAINNIHHNLTLFSQYCDENEVWFVFTVAPNKNTIYPEYMPSRYTVTDSRDNLERFTEVYSAFDEEYFRLAVSSQIEDAVKSQEMGHYSYCDMKETLLNAKNLYNQKEIPLYHKTDSHWNTLGALKGAQALIEHGFYHEPLPEAAGAFTAKFDWSGDLAEMIYPSDVPLDLQYYSGYDFTYDYVGRFRGFDDISIKTTCENGEGNLLMYRDSFGEAIIPFMAESFAGAEFTRTVPYRTNSITDGTVDVVVMEIVERNLGNLQKYAPVMPAPERDIQFTSAEYCGDVTIKCDESPQYSHIYGVLGEEFFGGDKVSIYVTINGITYEAFNAFEDEKLGMEEETCDRGFSLYIPKADQSITTDISGVTVTVVTDGGKTVSNAP